MSNDRFIERGGRRLLVTAAAVLAVAACSEPLETTVASSELQSMQADNVIYGMSSFLTASGVREGLIEADTAYMYADSSTAHLRQMTVVFYDPEGREIATVTGRTGRWAHDTDIMEAYGDVVLLVHADSSRIESQEIHYDPNLERIWSDSATVQTLKDGTVTSGSAFESDTSFENILIRDIRGGGRRVF